ncbi:hypothetical protein JXA63_00545 [Candidatus Woesebacteria bacterium]|nr:hypothetical protein [Candidatus Woesebacteria bacterium]
MEVSAEVSQAAQSPEISPELSRKQKIEQKSLEILQAVKAEYKAKSNGENGNEGTRIGQDIHKFTTEKGPEAVDVEEATQKEDTIVYTVLRNAIENHSSGLGKVSELHEDLMAKVGGLEEAGELSKVYDGLKKLYREAGLEKYELSLKIEEGTPRDAELELARKEIRSGIEGFPEKYADHRFGEFAFERAEMIADREELTEEVGKEHILIPRVSKMAHRIGTRETDLHFKILGLIEGDISSRRQYQEAYYRRIAYKQEDEQHINFGEVEENEKKERKSRVRSEFQELLEDGQESEHISRIAQHDLKKEQLEADLAKAIKAGDPQVISRLVHERRMNQYNRETRVRMLKADAAAQKVLDLSEKTKVAKKQLAEKILDDGFRGSGEEAKTALGAIAEEASARLSSVGAKVGELNIGGVIQERLDRTKEEIAERLNRLDEVYGGVARGVAETFKRKIGEQSDIFKRAVSELGEGFRATRQKVTERYHEIRNEVEVGLYGNLGDLVNFGKVAEMRKNFQKEFEISIATLIGGKEVEQKARQKLIDAEKEMNAAIAGVNKWMDESENPHLKKWLQRQDEKVLREVDITYIKSKEEDKKENSESSNPYLKEFEKKKLSNQVKFIIEESEEMAKENEKSKSQGNKTPSSEEIASVKEKEGADTSESSMERDSSSRDEDSTEAGRSGQTENRRDNPVTMTDMYGWEFKKSMDDSRRYGVHNLNEMEDVPYRKKEIKKLMRKVGASDVRFVEWIVKPDYKDRFNEKGDATHTLGKVEHRLVVSVPGDESKTENQVYKYNYKEEEWELEFPEKEQGSWSQREVYRPGIVQESLAKSRETEEIVSDSEFKQKPESPLQPDQGPAQSDLGNEEAKRIEFIRLKLEDLETEEEKKAKLVGINKTFGMENFISRVREKLHREGGRDWRTSSNWEEKWLSGDEVRDIANEYKIPMAYMIRGGHAFVLTTPPEKQEDGSYLTTYYDPMKDGEQTREVRPSWDNVEDMIYFSGTDAFPELSPDEYISGTFNYDGASEMLKKTGYNLRIPVIEGKEYLSKAKMALTQEDGYNCTLWSIYHAAIANAMKKGDNVFKNEGYKKWLEDFEIPLYTYESVVIDVEMERKKSSESFDEVETEEPSEVEDEQLSSRIRQLQEAANVKYAAYLIAYDKGDEKTAIRLHREFNGLLDQVEDLNAKLAEGETTVRESKKIGDSKDAEAGIESLELDGLIKHRRKLDLRLQNARLGGNESLKEKLINQIKDLDQKINALKEGSQ